MKKTRAILALILLTFLAPACGGQSEPAAEQPEPAAESTAATNVPTTVQAETAQTTTLPTTTVTLVPSDGAEAVEVEVEIADDDAERARGLMERTTLAENAGMLFVYRRETLRTYHMRNTLIPLSIAHIDADGRIVDIQDMEPLNATSYPAAERSQYSLEVNQGFFAERGIKVGDRVEGMPEKPE